MSNPTPKGTLSRRRFLQIGAAGVAGVVGQIALPAAFAQDDMSHTPCCLADACNARPTLCQWR